MKRFLIFIKSRILSRSYLTAFFGCMFFLFAASFISFPEKDNVKIGLYIEGEDGSSLPALLQEAFKDSVFEDVYYDNPEDLKEDVKSRKIECGFVFPGDMHIRIENIDLRESVQCFSTPFSLKTEVARETVNNAVIMAAGPYVMKESSRELFGDRAAKESLKEAEVSYKEYLVGDYVPKLDIIRLETVDIPEDKSFFELSKKNCLRYMTGLCVFVIMILSAYPAIDTFAFFDSLTLKEKRINVLLYDLSAGILPGGAGLLFILINNYGKNPGYEAVKIFVLIITTLIWQGFVRFFKRDGLGTGGGFLIVILANVILCPVIMDFSEMFPLVSFIRRFLPLGWY